MNEQIPIEIRAMSAPWRRGVELLVKSGNFIGKNIEMHHHDDTTEIQPTVTIPIESAQTLMDDLWAAGLRPTEGSGSAGSLAATERHLEDMRWLALGRKR